MSTPLRPAERAYSLSTRVGWEELVNAPPRQRPDLLTPAQIRKLPEQARAEYEERRSVWHANIGPLRTPQMRAVHEHLDDIVEANRQDGDKVRGAAACSYGFHRISVEITWIITGFLARERGVELTVAVIVPAVIAADGRLRRAVGRGRRVRDEAQPLFGQAQGHPPLGTVAGQPGAPLLQQFGERPAGVGEPVRSDRELPGVG
jgi:hypothetical protein